MKPLSGEDNIAQPRCGVEAQLGSSQFLGPVLQIHAANVATGAREPKMAAVQPKAQRARRR
jgi:hypothetical protein